MKGIHIRDIDNRNFWTGYIGCSYPNSYDEEEDISVSEWMQEWYTEEMENWWRQFTGYYEGVLDECDGYLEEPATLEMALSPDKTLKIEFHPGDTIYFINDEEIGSTGPHWKLQAISYQEVERLLNLEYGRQLFLLLLPLAVIKKGEEEPAREIIREQMNRYFPENLCESLSKCMVTGLMEF